MHLLVKRLIFSCTFFIGPVCLLAQSEDSISPKLLDSVTIRSFLMNIPRELPPVENMRIFAGKKTISFRPDGNRANLSANVSRMAFAQVPGLNIWDMDGAGTQVNIGSRGTDSHRSIEMNMRQNGYNTNSDMFGYPEDHYTPPMQAIDEIQFVRGSASLQFGSQFGGMMNYVMKTGDSTKPVSLESEQTAGSNGFFNSFNAVGGTLGKWSYYAYYDNRHGDGWRPNSRFDYHAYYASIGYQFNERASVKFDFSRMDYVQQIAGGLTDAQFKQNARQSFRARNYFNPRITVPAFTFHYALAPRTELEVIANFITGERNSVQLINTSNIPDTVNHLLGTFNPRQVDRDYYNGFTTEARILHRYAVGNIESTMSGGIRYSSQTTKRKQKGVGTIQNGFDLSLTKPYGIDLKLHSTNYAAFAENVFNISDRFSITPGVRLEIIRSSLDGVINNASFPVNYRGNRSFPLFGTGLQYQVSPTSQLYGNISQAYRPYLYAHVTPADQIGVIDPNLKDSKGYDIDLGYRGEYRDFLQFDVNAFYVYYGNRAGQLTLMNPDSSTYLYTTNVGNAAAKGIETYFDLSLWRLFNGAGKLVDVRLFNSLSFTHAWYTSGEISSQGKNVSLRGHRVEGTPEWIDRAGVQFYYQSFTAAVQYSYVGKSYSDANNTIVNPTGATGIVPAYHVWDFSASCYVMKRYHVSGGVNNAANAKYFTRRINMYPGPGILPADGRTFYLSFGIKL